MPEDLTGKRFGMWTVLATSQKPHYYRCQCDCGAIKDVYDSSLRLGKSKSCLSCSNRGSKPGATKAAWIKAKKKEGQTINGWKVLEVLPEKKNRCFLCRAICPKCGNESLVKLYKLRSIQHCAICNRNLADKISAINNAICVDDSSLSAVQARVNGNTNKNSTSGHNGVCKDAHGRWRAYIYFQRKQYYLGSYDTIEEAVTSRKEAEKIIYLPYLKEHEGWEKEIKNNLSQLKEKEK